MSQGGVFKNVATNSLGNQTTTYKITYTIEGGDMPAGFNPMMLLQGMQNGQFASNGNTVVTRGPKQITITSGGKNLDVNQMMAMFQKEMDSDLAARKGELDDICQNSVKVVTKKAPQSKPAQKDVSKKQSTQTTIKTEVVTKTIPAEKAQQKKAPEQAKEEVKETKAITEVPRVRGNAKEAEVDKPASKKQIPPPAKLPPKPVEPQFKVLPNELPSAIKLEFEVQSEKIISGKFSKEKNSADSKTAVINQKDCLGNFGLASLWYQNSAYTDGRYNMNDWKVETGSLGKSTAFRVHPPTQKFKQFLGSRHAVCFMLPQKAAYKLYSFQNNCLTLVAEKSEDQVKAGEYNVFTEATVSELGAPVIYLVEKSTTRISPYTVLKNGIEGATIFKDNQISIELIKIPLPQEAAIPENFSHGPGTHQNQYSPNRDNYRFTLPNKEAMVWTGPSGSIYMTHIDRLNIQHKSIKLQSKEGHIFAAATGNNEHLFYMIAQKGQGTDKTKGISMYLLKAEAATGKVLKEAKLSTDKANLNVWDFDTCMLVLSGSFLGMIITRRMTKHTDGLNHQGGLAAVFDTETLQLTKNHGQTSGHSFGSSLMLRSDGKFMGMDLGDNYPRGVHCWNFDEKSKQDRTVYSFKTQHGKQPKSPAGVTYPPYEEISKGQEKFYKWSNDNRTYTELAAPGLVEQEDGVMVFFCGENLPNPFDNSRTKDYCNCSRNVGYVKVSKQFMVLSPGPQEQGGFYCFNGKWNVLSNKGIQWITKFSGNENVSRLKTTQLGDKILVLFEIWDKLAYLNTQYMIVDKKGQSSGPVKLNVKIRLHKADDIFYDERSSSVVLYAGEKGKVMNRYEIKLAK